MKLLWLLVLVCVLRIPVDLWEKAPEHEREMVRTLAITEHCEREAKRTGERKFRIWEQIKDGMWELHIVPIKTEV